MSVYDLYKPMRNYLRQFPLLDSLAVVHAYAQYLQFNRAFPSDIEVDFVFQYAKRTTKQQIYEWQLDVLSREIILNAPARGPKSLRSWSCFANAINKISDLEENIHVAHGDLFAGNVWLSLNRIFHRQFPWQRLPNEDTLLRYFRIFNRRAFEPIIAGSIGLHVAELYTIGLALAGHFMGSFEYYLDRRIEITEITDTGFKQFCNHFSIDMHDLKMMVADAQSYDQDYAYTFNPLRTYPLVRVTLKGRPAVVAPIPTFLFRRFTDGMYYEIRDAPGFEQAFGNSFERYVGEVFEKANRSESLTICAAQPYHVGKDRKDSVDWIVSDPTGDLFIECKTKRLRANAKSSLASTEILDDDLDKMAGFIVQTYKTLIDALDGRYEHWTARADKPIYPLIVTLEEWFAVGNKILPEIDKVAHRKLAESQIDAAMMEKYPYTICAIQDLELVAQIIPITGIHTMMSKRIAGEYRLWPLYSFLGDVFKNELAQVQRGGSLFAEDMGKINPALKD